jgi:hypothetical protein
MKGTPAREQAGRAGAVQWRPVPRPAVPPSRLPNDLQVQQKEQGGEAGQ